MLQGLFDVVNLDSPLPLGTVPILLEGPAGTDRPRLFCSIFYGAHTEILMPENASCYSAKSAPIRATEYQPKTS